MGVIELVLLGLGAVIALATLAQTLDIPYPILLVLGGLVLGFVPGLPKVSLDPNVLFLLFIPPLVFSSAWFTSWRDFRANLRPIVLLATGLVLLTTAAVAAVAHLLIGGIPWAAAFVLGAIVASTDSVAATAIAERAGLPRRVLTILEGESLVNDAASLVAYRVAVAATVGGSFSLGGTALQFPLAAAGGVAVGVTVALLAEWVQRHLHNPPVEITLTLVVPFAAYIPADHLGASGVLAVVAAGILLGRHEVEIRSTRTRLETDAFWNTLVFLLNGLIFCLLGLQLHSILTTVSDRPALQLIGYAAATIAVVVLVRLAWMFPATYIPLWLSRRLRQQETYPPWKRSTIIGWAGMRGAGTMVIALALPTAIDRGGPFPDRALIVFLTFCVILATLVLQGLSLPSVIRAVGLQGDDGDAREAATARVAASQAAVAHLGSMQGTAGAPEGVAEGLRTLHQRRAGRFAARARGERDEEAEGRAEATLRLRVELVEAERRAIIAMRNRGEIGDAALREVLRDLDLEQRQIE